MSEMNYQIDLSDGTVLKMGGPYPGSDELTEDGSPDPRNGWTIGAIFFVEETLDSGNDDDDDGLGIKTPAHYLIFGGPPLEKAMEDDENAFFLKVYLTGQIRKVHCVCTWKEAMEMLVAFTGAPPMPEQPAPRPQIAPQAPAQQPPQPTAG